MKRLVVGLILGLMIVSPRFARAEDWSITNFQSDIVVHDNASITVHETIQVLFDGEHHGIFRELPLVATFNGEKASLPVETITVKQDGQAAIVSQDTNNHILTITIGDPDVLLRGQHSYDLTYTVVGAVNFFDTFDELNWNVTGDTWAVPITKASATIHLPSDDTPTTLCYTGQHGSTAQNCSGVASAGEARYASTDFLTVVSHWPKGVVTAPANYQSIRDSYKQDFYLWIAMWIVGLLMFVLTFWFVWRKWQSEGRDPEEPKTIVAQYEPPAEMTPAEAVVVMQQRVSQTAIVATLIDLAVHGLLKIEERETKHFLGKKKDFALLRVNAQRQPSLPFERSLLELLFDPAFTDAAGVTVLSTLRRHQSKIHPRIEAIKRQMAEQSVTGGWFTQNPERAVSGLATGGFIIGGLGVAGIVYGAGLGSWVIPMSVGVLASGAILFLFSFFMPRRTERGAKAHWQLKGFKLFLTTAEKYRLQWQEKERIFEKYLPYAIAFGVAEQWSKTFADVAMPNPDWYSGTSQMNSLYVWHSLSSFSQSFSAATIPSGGGSAGGVGGGGGGGGGGAW